MNSIIYNEIIFILSKLKYNSYIESIKDTGLKRGVFMGVAYVV